MSPAVESARADVAAATTAEGNALRALRAMPPTGPQYQEAWGEWRRLARVAHAARAHLSTLHAHARRTAP